ncbi:MAG: MBL fold metallo-hydrolase [Clostridia bacterium]|nr:MBL fold metallo-hydrolase [Clostridia bacterium]
MILKELKIDTWIGDPTNCYIVFDKKSKETMVIDPAGDVDVIEEYINILKGKLKYIYLTHCHADHILGVSELKNRCGGKILIHRFDSDGLNDANIKLSPYIIEEKIELEADSRIDGNDLIHLGELQFKVIHTPGHTKGGTCLYCEEEKCLFSGDTLFRGTWGRTGVPTANREEIIDSIVNKLMVLPDDTIVYPGHGMMTMIKDERPIYLELKPKLF